MTILSFAGFISAIADGCVAIATFFVIIIFGILFLVYFIAFAIGEGLGMGKID